MRRELLLARLMAWRATIDAWILEATADLEPPLKCCDKPQLQTVETYTNTEKRCLNCGTIFKAGSDEVSGAAGESDKVSDSAPGGPDQEGG